MLLRLVTCLFLAACAEHDAPLDPGPGGGYHVLFIGNSLTYNNDLPGTVAQLAALAHDTVVVESVARPNFAVIDHVYGMSNAVEVVRRDHWDFVVLQQGPTSQQLGRDTLILATRLIDPDVRAAGGRIAELMTWPAAPDRAVFDLVLQSCVEAAQAAVQGICFPAGEAWRAAWAIDPALPLYGPDQYHPSPLGTYLAALVVYEGVTGHDARQLPEQAIAGGRTLDVPGATVMLLQRIAHETVERIASTAASVIPDPRPSLRR
jgi:hypothetical protein